MILHFTIFSVRLVFDVFAFNSLLFLFGFVFIRVSFMCLFAVFLSVHELKITPVPVNFASYF